MKALKQGSSGPMVKRWQTYLRGGGYLIVADGKFGMSTRLATLDYQAKHRLQTDGIVGNGTFGAAMTDSFEIVDSGGTGKASANWPKAPKGLRALSSAERKERFGSFKFEAAPTPRSPEAIKITKRLAGFTLANAELPALIGVRGFPKSGKVLVHSAAAAPLEALIGAWQAADLLDHVQSWGGTWVARFVRGNKRTLSNHSWGTAFDINVAWNGLGRRPALVGEKGSVRELVALANKHGFFWGGHFSRRADGMHFELGAKTKP